jgi:hypothetical protein
MIEGEEDDSMVIEQAFLATSIISASASAVCRTDPSIQDTGDPCDLNNYLPDSGATQHMTPRLMDLINVVEGQHLGVEVTDGHIIKCSTTVVPGLSRWLFSITKFARHGHKALIQSNGIVLYFELHAAAVTLSPLSGTNTVAADIRVHNNDEGYHLVPSARQRDHSTNKKRLSLSSSCTTD